MRSVKFRSIFNGICRRLGIDPLVTVPPDLARSIIEHINERVETAWTYWDWPELSAIEERAFRSVWNATRQFRAGDEFYFLGDGTTDPNYYSVNSGPASAGDPPIGTPPSNATYFTVLDTVDTYIELDQVCKRPIGMVLGIYPLNPSSNWCGSPPLAYHPIPNAIAVNYTNGPTVFVHYQFPVPEFTIIPFVLGKTYQRDELVNDSDTGETFRVIFPTTGVELPSNTTYFRAVPFPAFMRAYVVNGTVADCLKEFDQKPDAGIEQVKANKIATYENDAEEAIISECRILQAQGQKHFYGLAKQPWLSQPWAWTNANIKRLTDACDEWPPAPPPVGTSEVVWQYHEEVVSLTGPAMPSLSSLVTVALQIGSKVEIVISGQGQEYRLKGGAADPTDPGQVAPTDYNLVTNNKHWERVA